MRIADLYGVTPSANGKATKQVAPIRISAPGVDLIVSKLERAVELLNEAKTAQQANLAVSIAAAAETFAKHQQLGEEAIDYAHSIKVFALRKLGELLKATERAKPAIRQGSQKVPGGNAPTLAELGISKKTSSLAQKVAALSDEEVAKVAAGVDTIAAASRTAHVSQNMGISEWYTPKEIIEAARRVMGSIDLDPASCVAAQKVVKAARWYGISDNGLNQEWQGRIWLNPPYSQPLIGQFVGKLISSGAAQATALVNNATETAWGQKLLLWCSAVCFPDGRVRFWTVDKIAAPLQGQMICYHGPVVDKFKREFAVMGVVLTP